MDKVFAPATLALAWTKVRVNKGAAGVDGQSVKRFAAKADVYLLELSTALREGAYRPQVGSSGSRSPTSCLSSR
jgi:RNA-directed DNA polymerase